MYIIFFQRFTSATKDSISASTAVSTRTGHMLALAMLDTALPSTDLAVQVCHNVLIIILSK